MCSELKLWKGKREKTIKVCFVLQYFLRLGFLQKKLCQDWQFYLDSRYLLSVITRLHVSRSLESLGKSIKLWQSRLVLTVWPSFSTSETETFYSFWQLKPNINKVIGLSLDCYWLLISAYLFFTFYLKNIKYVFNDISLQFY